MIYGQNFRLMLNSQCIAAATSCTIEETTEFEEISTKDSDGKGKAQSIKSHSFNISVDALLLSETDTNAVTIPNFINSVVTGTVLSFKCIETGGASNRTPISKPTVTLSGSVLVNDLTIKSVTNESVKISAKFIGWGTLSKSYTSQ